MEDTNNKTVVIFVCILKNLVCKVMLYGINDLYRLADVSNYFFTTLYYVTDRKRYLLHRTSRLV
jgi:hypothetical protein